VGILSADPHEILLIHSGFKGLVVHAKCNRDFYECELEFYFLFSRTFSFTLLKDEENLGVLVQYEIVTFVYPLLSITCSKVMIKL